MSQTAQRNLPTRPNKPEEVYAEWDDEFNCWAVFGLDSGFCYAQPPSEKAAKAYADEMNNRTALLARAILSRRKKLSRRKNG